MNTPLEEFLEEMLTPQRIDYLIKRNTIFLSRSVNHATEEVQPQEVDEKIEGTFFPENVITCDDVFAATCIQPTSMMTVVIRIARNSLFTNTLSLTKNIFL